LDERKADRSGQSVGHNLDQFLNRDVQQLDQHIKVDVFTSSHYQHCTKKRR